MKKIIIAPVGDYIEDIFVTIREFPTEKVILIAPKKQLKKAESAKKKLDTFRIPVKVIPITGNIWEEMFKEVAKVRKYEKGDVIVNVSTGDRNSRCAATSAAFVNGLKAVAVEGNDHMLLPVLKFSYYSMLEGKKMDILKFIYKEKDCCSSIDMLSKKLKMSLPLLSYHINGNLKSEGLKTMGLIDTEEIKGKTQVKISFLGKMLLKRYID